MGKKFVAFDAQGVITAFYDSADSPPPAGANVLPISDADWGQASSTSGYRVVGGMLVAPSAAQLLAQAQVTQIARLSAACQTQILAGFQSSALGAPHTYPAKPTDQTNLAGSVLASLLPGLPAGWTTPFWCEDAAGVWSMAPHTAAQIQQVGTDGKAAILAAITKNAQLAAQVDAATSIEAVQAVVW